MVGASDLATANPNFGWRDLEGGSCNPNIFPQPPLCSTPQLTALPVHTYGHGGGGFCGGSVTGGFVYRSSNPGLQGNHYVFGDWCTGALQSIVWDGGGGIVGSATDRKSTLDPLGQISQPVSFGEDGAGELLIVDTAVGAIFRVPVPEPGASASVGAALSALLALTARRRAGRRVVCRLL